MEKRHSLLAVFRPMAMGFTTWQATLGSGVLMNISRISSYASSPRENPLAGKVLSNYKTMTSERVIRGGSWENYDNLIRVSNRNREHPTQSYYLGFRCVAQPSR